MKDTVYLTLISFLLIISSFSIINGQQSSYFSVLRENWVLLNPAFYNHLYLEENDRTTLINASHRQQWIGVVEGAQQSNARFENIIYKKNKEEYDFPKMKWGVGVENETWGSLKSTGFYFNYAYTFKLNDFTELVTGLTFNFKNIKYDLEPSSFRRFDSDPIAVNINNQIRWIGHFNSGIFINHQVNNRSIVDSWYMGFSGGQLIRYQFGKNIYQNTDYKQFNFIGGMTLGGRYIGKRLVSYFEPTIILRYIPNLVYSNFLSENAKISTDFSLRYFINEHFWAGTGFGTSGNFSIEAGLNIQNIKKCRCWTKPKIRTGILWNIPFVNSTQGYSIELFTSIGLNTR